MKKVIYATSGFTTEEDWANYIAKKLKLDMYEADDLLHDLNNLRGDEWLEEMEAGGIPAKKIEQFKEFFHIDLDDDDEDWDE